jgi:hypothetical protein
MAAPTQEHNTDAAFHRAPVELWLFVFECFVHPDRDVHIFDQIYEHRRIAMSRLQDLQRVCRLWAVSLHIDDQVMYTVLYCTVSDQTICLPTLRLAGPATKDTESTYLNQLW